MKYIVTAKSTDVAEDLKDDLLDRGAKIVKQSKAAPDVMVVSGEGLANFSSPHLKRLTPDGEIGVATAIQPLEEPLLTASATPGWHLEAINHAQPPIGISRKHVDVYVLDTGIDTAHPELANNATFLTGDAMDRNGHGTHVAGLVRSQSYGVSKDFVNLFAVKVLGDTGAGSLADVAEGIIDCMDHHMTSGRNGIINLSLASRTVGHNNPLEDVIESAIGQGLHVVAAAGNNGVSLSDYDREDSNSDLAIWENTYIPAEYKDVLTVAAIDQDFRLASFSNFGKPTRINAPGVEITSTHLNGGYATMSGTSMAAPIVAGALAMMLSTTSTVSRTRDGVANNVQKLLDALTEIHTVTVSANLHTKDCLDMGFYRAGRDTDGNETPTPKTPERKSFFTRFIDWLKSFF